jgi:hypothetical protein
LDASPFTIYKNETRAIASTLESRKQPYYTESTVS